MRFSERFGLVVLAIAIGTTLVAGCATRLPPSTPTAVQLSPSPILPPTPTHTSSPQLSVTPSPTPPPPGDGLGATSTYRNQEIGFELDYPAEWYIEDVSAEIREQSSVYAVVLTSWGPGLGGVGGIPTGATKVDVIVIKSGTTTLQEAVVQLRQQWEAGDPPVTILSEEKWALAGDLQAVWWQVESLGEQSAAVITVINGNTVILSGLGDSDLFDAVARTMRPL